MENQKSSFIKVFVPLNKIVKTANTYHILKLNDGSSCIVAIKLESKYQDNPEALTLSIPEHFTFKSRKTALVDKKWQIVEENTLTVAQLKYLVE